MKQFYLFPLLLFFSSGLFADENQPGIGPANGTLIISGGHSIIEIYDEFIQAAGGKDAPIVYIPTANGLLGDKQRDYAKILLQNAGWTNVTVLDTTDRKIANSEEFVKPLATAKGVWFGGGRQWRLVDAYQDTLTEKMIQQVLERGGVIGGGSAGASIQGSYLARGDTKTNQIMRGDHQQGFGYLKNVAIDQHAIARNRHFDMFEILQKHPELLGISIDENTAIVVKNNEFKVIGVSYVIMYDGNFWSREGMQLKNLPEKNRRFYFLRKGDRYDLLKREVID